MQTESSDTPPVAHYILHLATIVAIVALARAQRNGARPLNACDSVAPVIFTYPLKFSQIRHFNFFLIRKYFAAVYARKYCNLY